MRYMFTFAAGLGATLILAPLAHAGPWDDGYWQGGSGYYYGGDPRNPGGYGRPSAPYGGGNDCDWSGGCRRTVTPNFNGTRQVTEWWNTPTAQGRRSFTVPGPGYGRSWGYGYGHHW